MPQTQQIRLVVINLMFTPLIPRLQPHLHYSPIGPIHNVKATPFIIFGASYPAYSSSTIIMSSKRKSPASPSSASASPRKTRRVSSRNISLKPETKKSDSVVPLSTTPSAAPNDLQHSDDSQDGLILREFYPPELSNGRALEYINGERQRPIETLNAALIETSKARSKILLGRSVVHWFRGDLRLEDNTALQLASTKARANKDGENAALIAMYILSPQDLEAHLTSPAKVDFILRTLKTLQGDLDKLNIPLHVEVVECREDLPGRVLELASEWDANHVYANTEYEVDELRRDANVIRMGIKKGIDFSVHHDLCIVNPGELATKVLLHFFPGDDTWC